MDFWNSVDQEFVTLLCLFYMKFLIVFTNFI